MKLIKILLLFVCFLSNHSGHCLETIDREHKIRLEKFDLKRDDSSLSAHTVKIATVVINPDRLIYNRLATEQEKKRIFKAMMGSIMVHNGAIDSLYAAKAFKGVNEKKYQRHCAAANQVDAAIRVLWGKFNKRESHTLQDLLGVAACTYKSSGLHLSDETGSRKVTL